MVTSNIIIFGSLALATLLGIFGQDISYFIHDHLVDLDLTYGLTIITITSILLYVVAVISAYLAGKKNIIDVHKIRRYYLMIGLIGILTSVWSFIVLAMWWG